jgi:FlaA1/EpsC-like NDP-sugar epimerase
MQEVAGLCRKDTVEVKIAPSMFELETQGHMNVLDLRSLNYADMLGRPLISIDRKPIADMAQEKRV